MSEQPSPAPRPGLLRRLAAGAWHVPAGFGLLFRNPSLWPLALLPTALTALLLVAGAILGALAIPRLAGEFLPGPDRVPQWLGFLMMLPLGIGAVAACMAIGFAVALFLSAPILERLSLRVETRLRGQAVSANRGLRWEIAQSFRGSLYFLTAAPIAFLVSLIPLVGPPLGALWTARVLSFQLTDPPLARRGLAFADRRAWHRKWRAESLGFGLGGVITLLVPLANLLLGPALTVGGTMLVLGLEPATAGAGTEDEPSPRRGGG